jgi:hypothetical protein
MPGDGGANKGGSPGDTTPKVSPTPTPVPPPADPSAIKNAPGIYIWHYYTSGKYTAIEAEMTVTHAPAPSNEGGIIFWANQVFFEKEAGYVGLQIVGEKKKAIFSLWTALSSDKGNPFTGEGDGYQYLVEYDWQLGRTYKLGIQMTGEDGTGRYWNGYVIDTMTGIRTDLATHKAPLSMGFIRNNVAWTEYASHGTCMRPYTRIEFANSTVSAGASKFAANTAVLQYPYHACTFSNGEKLSGQAVALSAGGETSRVTPAGRLW